MNGEHRALAVAVLALVLVGAAVAGGGAGDDAAVQDGGHDHSDGSSDDGSFLPAPGVVPVLAVVGLAAYATRRRG